MSMRPVFDPSGGPDLLVTQLIGKAYDTVRRVSLSLPELQRLDGVLGEIDGLAQTTVDHALSVALPVFVAEVQQHVDEAKVWADASEVSATKSAASAEEAKQAALDSVKTNLMYQFEFKVGQFIYDVTAIAGRTDITTGGMALVVNGLVDYDFTIIDETTFRLNNQGKYPDGTVMRLLINARFDDVFTSIKELEEMITRQFQEQLANSALEVPVLYAPGINITRPTQTVTYLGRDYRVNIPYLPLVTSTWSADGPKMVLAGDGPLRDELLRANGAGLVKNGDETVASALDRAGVSNELAWGNVKYNKEDYATFSPSIVPPASAFTRTNFSANGVHSSGTVGTLTAPAVITDFGYYMLKIKITTVNSGNIKIQTDTTDIFGDRPEGYYFSNGVVLNDATENNRYVDNSTFYFKILTSGAGYSSLRVETDTAWSGTIDFIELYTVTPTKFFTAGGGSDNGHRGPVGCKTGSYNRGDLAFGDKFSLGAFQYDGVYPTPAYNVAIGIGVLASLVKGDENTGVGTWALSYAEGSNNVALGYSALKYQTKGQENTGVGYKTGVLNSIGSRNTTVGFWASGLNRDANQITALGWYAGRNAQGGDYNTYIGSQSGLGNGTGVANTYLGALAGIGQNNGAETFSYRVALGAESQVYGTQAVSVGGSAVVGTSTVATQSGVAVGYMAKARGAAEGSIAIGRTAESTATGVAATAVGHAAKATGDRTVAIGESSEALAEQSTAVGGLAKAVAQGITAVGSQAGRSKSGINGTYLGRVAGNNTVDAYSNVTCLGYLSEVTGSNQVQLGNSLSTVYAFGTVQNRSDLRDKADVTKTELGLKFIMGLKPIQGRWDIRSDYTVRDEDGNVIVYPQDGRFKRKRLHQWFGAQDVIALCVEQGVEFGGVQDHTVAEGEDVLSIGYDEFIPPIVKAMQEQNARLDEQDERLTRIEEMLKELLEK